MSDQPKSNEPLTNARTAIIHVPRAKNQDPFFSAVKRDFVQWLAMPKEMRYPKTQREFAKLYGVHESTLSSWRPDVEAEVVALVRHTASLVLPDVMASLKTLATGGENIPADVRLEAIKVYLEFVFGWDEKNPGARSLRDFIDEEASRFN